MTVGRRVALVLRPEEFTVRPAGDGASGPTLAGTVAEIGYQGDSYRLSVAVGGMAIKVKVSPQRAAAIQPGADVRLGWDRDTARLLPADDESSDA